MKEADGGVMIIMTDDIPDWVRTPPELGEIELRVLGSAVGECPKCEKHQVLHLILDSDDYRVAQCHKSCGFVWYGRVARSN